jgi:uncharacterized protein (DUF1800 family)
MNTSTLQESESISRRDFVNLASKASASVVTGVSGDSTTELTPMRNSTKSYEDSGTLAAMQAASSDESPNIDDYRAHATSLPKLSIIALTRLGFGPTPEDVADFESMGATDDERLSNWLDKQLNPDSIADSDCDAKIQAAGFNSPGKSLRQSWSDYYRSDSSSERYIPAYELERMNFMRAAHSKKQLFEVLVDFWHNHFNIYAWDSYIASVFMNWDEQVIRKHALGNFREFIEDMTKHTAMLYYLDNYTNTSAGFNENFARELFDLHTMGAENYFGVIPKDDVPKYTDGTPRGYVDADVYDAAECFTGWTVNSSGDFGDYGDFLYRNDHHSQGEKRILQQVIPAFGGESDGYKVFDLLASHPGTARYVCRKLCRRLIMDHPPESLVSEIADVFLANKDEPDQLKIVTRAVIMSDEFRTTFGEKVKRPLEMAVSAFRATGAEWPFSLESSDGDRILDYLENTGQGLFRHPTPDGYSDFKEDWLSTNPIMSIWRLMIYAVEESDNEKRNLRIEENTPSSVRSAAGLVDYWSDRILGRPLPEGEREGIVDFMADGRSETMDTLWDTNSDVARRLRYMVSLILLSPTNFLR